MNIYYIRTAPSDWQTMIDLGVALGALQADEDGNVTATHGGGWDVIGPIYRPTGNLTAEGEPETAPLTNAAGEVWQHANLITPLTLGEIAAQMAQDNPAVAAALSDVGRFFVVDELGQPKVPTVPARVFFGVSGE